MMPADHEQLQVLPEVGQGTEGAPGGYANPAYVRSLDFFGAPFFLSKSGGAVLKRRIHGSDYSDAMGVYPLFACRNWEHLASDIDRELSDCVSVTLVTDPFGDFREADLRGCFTERFAPFKSHYVVDLAVDLDKTVSRHHRYESRKGLKHLRVFRTANPTDLLSEWNRLYEELVVRHDITGIQAFSAGSFYQQLSLAEMTAFAAEGDDGISGMQLWITAGEVAYYHLSACSDSGYRHRAAYSLMWEGLQYFQRQGYRYANLGSVAGARDATDGLSQYKRGWSNEERISFLCGKILNHEVYEALNVRAGGRSVAYFPAYRGHEK